MFAWKNTRKKKKEVEYTNRIKDLKDIIKKEDNVYLQNKIAGCCLQKIHLDQL